MLWRETGADLGLVAVADGLISKSLRLVPSKTSPRMSNTRPLRASLSICEFFEQAVIDVAFAGFLGDEVPEMADLFWPMRWMRPKRCSSRLGFQGRS